MPILICMARDVVYARAIGARIRSLRLTKSLKATQLASGSGLSSHTLWRYEMGRQIPGVDVLRRIAKALDVSLDELAAPAEAA